jgi:Rrf2 family nitric oxide-sensitive transcriptional repressor
MYFKYLLMHPFANAILRYRRITMRLTSFTDYSLRVLMYLAVRPERRATISEIAADFRISEEHLRKVVHLLGKAQLLANARGKGGGLALSRPAEAISLGEVVREAEGKMLLAECFDRKNNTCVITSICQLKGVFGEAVKEFNAVLDHYTLADLVSNRKSLAKILFHHKPKHNSVGRAP